MRHIITYVIIVVFTFLATLSICGGGSGRPDDLPRVVMNEYNMEISG